MATGTENIVSINIPKEEVTKVLELLTQIQAILKPYLIATTPEQRKQLLKMGDKSVAFVEKILDYTKSNPEFVPSYMNLQEFTTDVQAVEDLGSILRPIEQLFQSLSDTEMLSGSEAYTSSLIYYNAVKQAAKSNIPNAASIYDDLSKRFDGQGRRKVGERKVV